MREISDYFTNGFKKLYATTNSILSTQLVKETIPCITDEDNQELIRVPSEEEVKKCIWSMHPLKASGPEGFP